MAARLKSSASPRRGHFRALGVGLALVLGLLAHAPMASGEDQPPQDPATAAEQLDPPLARIEGPAGEAFRVDVVGTRPILGTDPREALRVVPGSAVSLDLARLRRTRTATSLQEVLRGQTGIHLRDEASAGVVPNIGFRGLNPDRSERMLFLEDGVPAGFAPYTENAAYYVPPADRIATLELLKGSGQVLHGPHTVGAVMNFVTPEIPRCATASARVTGGTHGHLSTFLSGGTTRGRLGVLVTAFGSWGQGYRDFNDFEVRDLMLKTRWAFSSRSHVTVKFAAHGSDSQNTYLGLTSPMFDADPFQNPASQDTYEVRWYNGQVTHRTVFSPWLEMIVNVYAAGGRRDWDRQDFARNTGFAPAPANTVATVGDPAVDGGAVYLRSSFGSRDRDARYWGVEPRFVGTTCLLGRRHAYEFGARYHDEQFVDARNNRATFAATPVLRDRSTNDTRALSVFAQDDVQVNPWLHVIGGLRVEHYESTRHFDVQAGASVDVRGASTNTELIPGLGFTAQLPVRATTLFGGVHRGFSPPRVAQAIDNTGMDLQLDAERSWNWELGVRGDPRPWWHYEVTGFYMDFENQVVPANESGGASTKDVNAGQTEHAGLELATVTELVQMLSCRAGACRPRLYLDLGYTLVHTENVTPNGLFRGKDLPYAPRHLGHLGLRGELPAYGLSASAHATYAGSQFADQASTAAISNDGTNGRIAARWLLDLTLRWKVRRTKTSVFCSVHNVLDERYVVSRAPQGTFAGAPRHAFFGVEWDL